MLKHTSDSRKQQLQELKCFTDAVNEEIAGIARSLDWTVDSVINVDKEYFVCPYDASHRLTDESLNDHLASCQWRAEGYAKSDVPLSEPALSEDSLFSMRFDEQLLVEVLRKAREQNPTMRIGTGERLIPRTSDRLITDFTSDERRALYNYVVAHTEKPDIGQDIADIDNLKPQDKKNKKLSFVELLVQERNLKRRRTKHRGVHTNKKSHTEILREVINQQMETYVDYISEQSDVTRATDVRDTKMKESSDERTAQDRAERLYKVFHGCSRNDDDFNSKDRNGHYYSKRDNPKRDRSEERSYGRSKERDSGKRHSDEYNETRLRTHGHSSHRKRHRETSRDRSQDRKSHKRDKHQSKDKHKDKHRARKHKSGDRDRSTERDRSRHSNRKHKKKDKEY